MALIICPECGKEFSDKAKACPNCGCPVEIALQNQKSDAEPGDNAEENHTPVSDQNAPSQNTESKKPHSPAKLVIGAVIAAAAVFGIVFALTANSRTYSRAEAAYENGDYEAAESIYESLGDYKDAEGQASSVKTKIEEMAAQKAKEEAEAAQRELEENDHDAPVISGIPGDGITADIDESFDVNAWIAEQKIIAKDAVWGTVDVSYDDSGVDYANEGEYNITLSAEDGSGNSTEETVPVVVVDRIVHKAFDTAVNLKKTDLTEINGQYYYDGIPILASAVRDTIDDLESNTLFLSVEKQLESYYESYYTYDDWSNNDFTQTVWGIDKCATYGEMLEVVEPTRYFIQSQNPVAEIVNALQRQESVSGSFDYVNRTFDFTITDLNGVAGNLKITKKMFGYLLAALDSAAYDVDIDNNEAHLACKGREFAPALDADDFVVNIYDHGTIVTEDMIGDLAGQDPYEAPYMFITADEQFSELYYSDDSDDYGTDDSSRFFYTKRGISPAASYNGTLFKYGSNTATQGTFSREKFGRLIIDLSYVDWQNHLEEGVTKYVSYKLDGYGSIIFVFDKEDHLYYLAMMKGTYYLNLSEYLD